MARRLAGILAADVVGYSRLMGADEAGTLDRLKSLRRELVQPRIASHGGRIVKLIGDGLLAEFPSVVEAVRCAVDLQQAMAGRERELPDESRIRLRIGVNLGDIIVEGSDIYGNGVNVAARLEDLAQPGGICISGAAKDQLSGKLNSAFEPLGTQHLKNILEPIAVYRFATSLNENSQSGQRSFHPDFRISTKPFIAVLPFQNLSKEDDQELFADGLTEDIITRLSYLRDLMVISRTSTFAYKGRAVRINDVVRDLGVR
ncbi:MAG: adenylate/guanylate cyclase domain-containing protein, partial [Kiloniellales bacterium]|nr:adenylate/guanylate cyclase domain-containing protein [Kiloniellales bacterium]